MNKDDILFNKQKLYLQIKYPLLYTALLFHKTHLNKKITFRKRHYQKEIFLDNSDYIIVKKSTQNGISEYLIIKSIYEAMKGKNVLYVLPTEIIKSRYVSSRFNKTLEYSELYKNYQKEINSTTLKQFDGVINFIGSNAPANFTEFVAHTVIIDELDRCNQQNIEMAVERQSSVTEKKMIKVSNPTINGYGISNEYEKTDQKKWYIKCDCGNEFNPDFFKNVVNKVDVNDYVLLDKEYEWNDDRDINIICEKCKKPVDRFQDGRWVSHNNKSNKSGYHISKLFSTNVSIRELVDRFKEGLTNNTILQRFYNGDLGESFTSEGARITKEMLKKISKEYSPKESSENICICGIDVGNDLTTVIGELYQDDKGFIIKIIKIKNLKNIEDIIDITNNYNIICGVIDSRPETRLARNICAIKKGFWMVEYLTESNKDIINMKDKIYKTDRTMSLDNLKENILLERIQIPEAYYNNDEFVSQIEAPVRIWEDKINGEGRYIWAEGNNKDHYCHALNYMLLAKKLLVMASK